MESCLANQSSDWMRLFVVQSHYITEMTPSLDEKEQCLKVCFKQKESSRQDHSNSHKTIYVSKPKWLYKYKNKSYGRINGVKALSELKT